VKTVDAGIDVQRGVMVVDADMCRAGSDDFVEFDSMINLRPSRANRSQGVEDRALRAAIRRIVDQLVVQ
jgi:hypothetical protein